MPRPDVTVLARKSGSVVFHPDDRALVVDGHRQLDDAPDGTVLDSIAEQIVDGLAQPVGIAAPQLVRRRGQMDGLVLLLGERPVRGNDLAEQAREVGRLAFDGDIEGIHHGVRDQVVDHPG